MSLPAFSPARLPWLSAIAAQLAACIAALPAPCPALAAALPPPCPALAAALPAPLPPGWHARPPVPAVLQEFAYIAALPAPWPALPATFPALAARFPPALQRAARSPPWSRERPQPSKLPSSRKYSSSFCVFVGGSPLSGCSARPARTLRR